MIFERIFFDINDSTSIDSLVHQWKNGEKGLWVQERCPNINFTMTTDFDSYQKIIVISGRLTEEDKTFYTLKFK